PSACLAAAEGSASLARPAGGPLPRRTPLPRGAGPTMTLLEQGKDAFDESHYDRKYFEGHLARYDGQVYRERVRNVERFMGEVAGQRVLDLGCGVGFFGGTAQRRGARVTGLDFSAVALELCRQRQPGMAILRGDATRLPFASASFDLVLLNDIIEH